MPWVVAGFGCARCPEWRVCVVSVSILPGLVLLREREEREEREREREREEREREREERERRDSLDGLCAHLKTQNNSK